MKLFGVYYTISDIGGLGADGFTVTQVLLDQPDVCPLDAFLQMLQHINHPINRFIHHTVRGVNI